MGTSLDKNLVRFNRTW